MTTDLVTFERYLVWSIAHGTTITASDCTSQQLEDAVHIRCESTRHQHLAAAVGAPAPEGTLNLTISKDRLREAPEQRMRVNDLKDASLFTKSGITRLIDRIEASGFVTRVRSGKDRRGVYVAITREGNDKINQVWPDHVASIWKHYGQYLDADEMDAIETASRRILADTHVPSAVPEA